MKKLFLFLNILWVLTLIWIPFIFFFYDFAGGVSMKGIWLLFVPALLASLLAGPLNILHLHLLARSRGVYARLAKFLEPKLNIILPPAAFFYLAVSMLFVMPVIFEFSVCVFYRGDFAGDYCYRYLRSFQLIADIFCLFVWIALSAALARVYLYQFKKDRKSLFGLLLVALSMFIMYWLMMR